MSGYSTPASTHHKRRDFLREPMNGKSVKEVPGIDDALGDRLSDMGFNKAYVLLGQYFFLRMKKRNFKKWLKKTCNANGQQRHDVYKCMKEWCEQNVF